MKTLREYIDRLDEISRKGINEEQWYAHDFGQWQSDANAKNLDIVQSETDETGNNLQAFNAVDSSGAVVGKASKGRKASQEILDKKRKAMKEYWAVKRAQALQHGCKPVLIQDS